jgi:hypothetical protein
VKPNAFSRRKPAKKPSFSGKRKSKHKRKMDIKRERERANNEYIRMHSVEESLLQSCHSFGREANIASGREREIERKVEGAVKPNAFSRKTDPKPRFSR